MRNIRRVRLKHKTENETHQDRTPKGKGKGPRPEPGRDPNKEGFSETSQNRSSSECEAKL